MTYVSRSDIWAFGGILYQLLVGKPPFRTATDYLTFQKILHAEYEYPEGFDSDAKALIDDILVLHPAQRPTPAEIKTHRFFAPIDFSSVWQIPAPPISTGLTKPVETLASLPPDNDIWAVFDDEVSDGGFQYDDDGEEASPGGHGSRPAHHSPLGAVVGAHSQHRTEGDFAYGASPVYDHRAAARAVAAVDDLVPPRPAWMDSPSPSPGGAKSRKPRGWSRGSARTNSSSSSRGAALAGLLEHISFGGTSNRTSRGSGRSDDRPMSRGRDESGSRAQARDSDDRMIMTLPGVDEEVNRNDKWWVYHLER